MKGKKTGGRVAGTPNKATEEIRELARGYAPRAVKELARLAKEAESEQARVSAIGMLLDRGYGKAAQAIEHSGPDGGPIQTEDVSDGERARALLALLAKTEAGKA